MAKYNEVAAKWWVDRIRNISPANFDSGDHESDMAAYEKAVKESKDKNIKKLHKRLDSFEKLLAEEIAREVKVFGKITIYCEYSPDSFLAGVAKAAKVRDVYFPLKTVMCVTKEKIEVKCGYNATYTTIYPE